MKKALIVLLILGLAGGLFAQTFSGNVRTGALFTFDGEDNPVKGTEEDGWRGQGVRAELSFKNSGDDWGVSVGASANVADNANSNTASGINVESFNGWVKFANIFKLTAGKGVGDDWYWNVNEWSNMQDSAIGARLQADLMPGLNVGLLFGYPNRGGNAGKIVNFFEETGIGAKYEASLFSTYASVQFESPETDGYTDLDATLRFGLKVPVVGLFDVNVVGKVANLFSTQKTWMEEKISGNVAGLGWYVWAREDFGEPLTVAAHAGVDYGIPINDKASATVGADADVTILDEFGFDGFDVWAELGYGFNGNVSTSFTFEVDVETGDTTKFTPWLKWLMKYSF